MYPPTKHVTAINAFVDDWCGVLEIMSPNYYYSMYNLFPVFDACFVVALSEWADCVSAIEI